MKLTEIQENTILIAEFLCAKRKDKRVKYGITFIFPNNYWRNIEIEYDIYWGPTLEEDITNEWYINDIKFHSSWDWLMPVVEKIESLGFTVSIYHNICKIEKNIDYLTNEEYVQLRKDFNSKLDSVYQTVVEFIKKYNNENK